MTPEVASVLAGSGPLGILILYLMYLQKLERDTRTTERARRDEIDRDRIATDKALVATLTSLGNKIDGMTGA